MNGSGNHVGRLLTALLRSLLVPGLEGTGFHSIDKSRSYEGLDFQTQKRDYSAKFPVDTVTNAMICPV